MRPAVAVSKKVPLSYIVSCVERSAAPAVAEEKSVRPAAISIRRWRAGASRLFVGADEHAHPGIKVLTAATRLHRLVGLNGDAGPSD